MGIKVVLTCGETVVKPHGVISKMFFEVDEEKAFCYWEGDYRESYPCKGVLVRKISRDGEWLVAKPETLEKYLKEVSFWVKDAILAVTGKETEDVYSDGQSLFSQQRQYRRCYEYLNNKLGFPREWMGLSKKDYALLIYERNGTIFNN